jgi:tRNA(Arg) A34 adenosine deaminase TadA
VTDHQHSTIAETARQLISKRDRGLYPAEDLEVAFLIHNSKEPMQPPSGLPVDQRDKGETAATLYFAFHSRSDRAPTSAIVRLIQGIYAAEPDQSRVIVRNRIYTTAALTAMCRGMIAVAAKRATDQIFLTANSPDFKSAEILERIDLTHSLNGLSGELKYGEQTPPEHHSDQSGFSQTRNEKYWIDLALELVRPTQILREEQKPLFQYNRPVAAVLISREGELLAWALNTNAVNKTLHAELNLVQSFYRKFGSKIPAGSKLFTTLKPCKMCAGMLFDVAEDMRSFEVIYAEDDPGLNARNTALEMFQRKF